MEKQDIKVSVIVPCYKAERYVAGCIESLLRQSCQNLEVIVVIDGDVDKSADIARQYPVKTIVLKENKGVSAARNIGFDASTGDFIHFMDVDDEISEDFYLRLVEAAEDTASDIAISGMIFKKRAYKCQLFGSRRVLSSTKDKFLVTWVAKWGYVWRYLFRKSMLQDNKLRFEEGRLIEDLPFAFKAFFYARRVVTVPGTAFTHNTTEGSLTNRRDKRWKKGLKEDLRHSRKIILDFDKAHRIGAPALRLDTGLLRYFLQKCWLLATRKSVPVLE